MEKDFAAYDIYEGRALIADPIHSYASFTVARARPAFAGNIRPDCFAALSGQTTGKPRRLSGL